MWRWRQHRTVPTLSQMTQSNSIDESGMLLRDGGGFILRGDDGRVWRLVLPRTPVDLVEKRVRIVGRVAGDLIDADGVQPG